MKRSFLPAFLLLLLASAFSLNAQTTKYGNEWIDYSKTYYKFKVGKTGICRIYRSALTAAGLPLSVNGSAFMLFRDGIEMPIYVSAEAMGANDYIEFWGRKADGTLDKELYLNPTDQPNDRSSLFTDTAAYFLTYDAGGSHMRFAQAANAIPGGSLTPAPYCLATVGFYPKGDYMPGPNYTYDTTSDFISPQFDAGEGFVDAQYRIMDPTRPQITLAAPNLVSGVGGMLYAGVSVRAIVENQHRVRLSINNTQLADSQNLLPAQAVRFGAPVPSGAFSAANQIGVDAVFKGPHVYDYFGVSFVELEYPRDFNMTGIDQATLKLPATGAAQYVEFSNMSAGRLYDITNGKWYDGNTAVAGKTRFYLDPSMLTRQIAVMSNGAASIASLSLVKSFKFTDYTSAAAQGDFIIITHPTLLQPAGGTHPVQDYAAYRASANGGSHKAVVADVSELYDQFAYGYDIHPLSIRHFLNYAYDAWSTKPQDVFLIGRGIFYSEYAAYRNSTSTFSFPLVPTYGVPGSDMAYVTFGGARSPRMHIGRLSVWNAGEVSTYLNKVQQSEALYRPAALPTVATELWKKQALHVLGAQSAYLQHYILEPTMNGVAPIIAGPYTGKMVTTIAKSDNIAVTQVNSQLVDSLLRTGVSMITFYGHGSPTAFDYNLTDPTKYSNGFRMGQFIGLGCDLAQMFQLSVQRTVAEKYVLAPTAGVTTFLAASNTSYTDFDHDYINLYYTSMAKTNYGGAIGEQVNATYDRLYQSANLGSVTYPNMYATQLECMILSGDPSIVLPSPALPDYHVADEGLVAIPANVTTSADSFRLRVSAFNLAKAIDDDTVIVKVEHINPSGVTTNAGTYTIYNLRFSDTSAISIPIDKNLDLGLNKYRITIDAPNRYAEVSELNNAATLELFISSDNLVPVYPYEFAIVNKQDLTLKASTLNPFRVSAQYRIEMDTTELFNSPAKVSTTMRSNGGILRWKPGVPLMDSTVYYWRTAFDSGNIQWTTSSFIYLANSGDGWNQSHYFQYLKDFSAGISLKPNRQFGFGSITNRLEIRNIVLCNTPPTSCNLDAQYMKNLYNDSRIDQSSYNYVFNALSVTVIDTFGRIWQNSPTTRYGADPYNNPNGGLNSRQFNLATDSGRYYAANFLTNVVPNGWYVAIKNSYWHGYSSPNFFIDKWKADTAVLGPGKSLYHALYNMGFNKIDSFYKERVFVFMCKKGDNNYPLYQGVTDSLTQYLAPIFPIQGSDLVGQYNSTVVGPAKAWDALKWRTFATDTFARNDTSTLTVMGIDKLGAEVQLFDNLRRDTSLQGISAALYPKLRLLWKGKDSLTLTSPQMAYWRVLYTPVPEAGLNPNTHLVFSDTLSQGQMQTFSTAIENLTPQPMDSMLVRYKIVCNDGVTRTLGDRRYRGLKSEGDTLHASITFDPAPYPGKNLFFVEANPGADQPEQYHPNNLGYLPFRIGVDTRNPLLDVTFDGVHILNGDIVSARPFIKIRLKDENRYLALDDTSLVKVSMRYPSDSTEAQPVPFDGVRCRFIPATKTEPVNEAYIEFRPELVQDGTYQLSVTGIDKSGNTAGGTAGSTSGAQYKIAFEVDNKPSITNVLNYPNPFSTSTAFVFTLTGSQIPSQFKIQILSVTGKVVREITKGELGALHIGRNITDYKWDGRDQFGQLLGNGVYLYRVVTSLNGEDMALREDNARATRNGGGIDRFFKNGYGKMYIMR